MYLLLLVLFILISPGIFTKYRTSLTAIILHSLLFVCILYLIRKYYTSIHETFVSGNDTIDISNIQYTVDTSAHKAFTTYCNEIEQTGKFTHRRTQKVATADHKTFCTNYKSNNVKAVNDAFATNFATATKYKFFDDEGVLAAETRPSLGIGLNSYLNVSSATSVADIILPYLGLPAWMNTAKTIPTADQRKSYSLADNISSFCVGRTRGITAPTTNAITNACLNYVKTPKSIKLSDLFTILEFRLPTWTKYKEKLNFVYSSTVTNDPNLTTLLGYEELLSKPAAPAAPAAAPAAALALTASIAAPTASIAAPTASIAAPTPVLSASASIAALSTSASTVPGNELVDVSQIDLSITTNAQKAVTMYCNSILTTGKFDSDNNQTKTASPENITFCNNYITNNTAALKAATPSTAYDTNGIYADKCKIALPVTSVDYENITMSPLSPYFANVATQPANKIIKLADVIGLYCNNKGGAHLSTNDKRICQTYNSIAKISLQDYIDIISSALPAWANCKDKMDMKYVSNPNNNNLTKIIAYEALIASSLYNKFTVNN